MTTPGQGALLLLSDLHARYHLVDAQIAHAEDELGQAVSSVVVLGDFGMFAPNLYAYFRRDAARFTREVAFVEGNHEDFANFQELKERYRDVVTHLERGQVRRIGLWRCLCVGGAKYMDSWSTPHGSEITPDDIATCLAQLPGSIDLVLSHDCPSDLGVPSNQELLHLGPPGLAGLAEVARHLRPRWWFFGHHHRWHDCERAGTRFVGLPQSFEGYVLLRDDGELIKVAHEVAHARPRPWWRRLLWPR